MIGRLVWCLVPLWCLLCSAVVSPTKVNLREARVTGVYRKTLDRAYDRLVMWCVVNNWSRPDEIIHDFDTLNKMLSTHVQYLYDEKFGVSAGRLALLSVQNKYRHTKSQLHYAWDAVKSWEMLAPVSLRVPMPFLVMRAIFSYAMLRGFNSYGADARDWICFGIGVFLSFTGLLRPGEFCTLTAGKCAAPGSSLHSLRDKVMMTIVNGKNRRVFGRIQIAISEHDVVARWMTWLLAGMHPDARIFTGGAAKFRSLMKLACKALNITHLKFSPASLRAGGATFFFSDGVEFGKIKYRGRWAALHTLEHYVQEAAAALVLVRLEPEILTIIEQLVEFGSVFDAPPQAPWSLFFSRARQLNPRRRRHGHRSIALGGALGRTSRL